MTNQARPLLDALLGSSDEFIANQWPHQATVHHGVPSRLPEVMQAPELHDVRSLAGAYGEDVTVWFGGSLAETSLAPLYGRRFLPRDALGLHEAGATLFFERVEPWVPSLHSLCRQLERELGTGDRTVYCSAFASPRGGSSLAHFDPDVNFSVQLRGKKRWCFAPNEHVECPTVGYSVVHEPAEVHRELRQHASGGLPRSLPAGATEAVLHPGSVLFVPHGWWHETQTIEDSLAVVFVVSPESWADVVLRRLRQQLVADARWRAMATSGPSRVLPSALRHELGQHLSVLTQPGLDYGCEPTRYRRNASRVAERIDDAQGPALRVPDEHEVVVLRLEPPLVPLVDHLLGIGEGVDSVGLRSFREQLGESTVESVLAELVDCRVLEVAR